MTGLINIPESLSIAVHSCVFIASDASDAFKSVRVIAEEMAHSRHHATKVIKQLASAGILETERGPSGGARLAKAADKITLFEIYVAVCGAPVRHECILPKKKCNGTRCVIGKAIAEENKRLTALLKTTTVADIVKSTKRK